MSPRTVLRAAHLDAKAVARQLGLIPPLIAVLLCAGAAVQEPSIFRTPGLELAWPFVFGSADMLALAACLLATPPGRGSLPMALVRAGAVLSVSLGLLLVCTLCGVVADLLLGAATPWLGVGSACLRFVLCWVPIALLTQSPGLGERFPLRRLAVLGAALAVQSAIHPVSVHAAAGPAEYLAALLASVGAACALTGPQR